MIPVFFYYQNAYNPLVCHTVSAHLPLLVISYFPSTPLHHYLLGPGRHLDNNGWDQIITYTLDPLGFIFLTTLYGFFQILLG